MVVELAKPSRDHLPGFVAALRSGWSPSNVRKAETIAEQLAAIERDPEAFVHRLDNPTAAGGPVTLPDGSSVPRLPSIQRWLWDGAFAGVIGLRWQDGTSALPAHVLGHIGFAVVPWKQRRGYAQHALGLLLPEAKKRGLSYVELTADPDNIASQKVVLANGGKLLERFRKTDAYGGGESLRFRIDL